MKYPCSLSSMLLHPTPCVIGGCVLTYLEFSIGLMEIGSGMA